MRTVGLGLLAASLWACGTPNGEVETDTVIVGRVVDAETEEALAGARITTMPATEQVETDADGEFVITEGAKVAVRYQITARLDGYETVTRTLTTRALAEGSREENRADFELTILKVCTPGTRRCALGLEEEAVELCGARGNQWVPESCPETQVCAPELSACVAGRRLTVATAGAGSGGITSSPGGINCGPSCEKVFAAGSVVALTATPIALSGFEGWSGACTGTERTCTLTLDADQTATARFEPTGFQLTVEMDGFGSGRVTSMPAGINCGRGAIPRGTCTAPYGIGEMVTLTAVPATTDGSTFGGWGGACAGTQATCAVTMSAARTVRARFDKPTHPLAVTKAGTGDGTVVSTPEGIDCGLTCQSEFGVNEMVSLAATPDESSTFAGWSGACTGTGACTVTMSQARTVTATFEALVEPFYLQPLAADASCVSLFSFDDPSPLTDECGGTAAVMGTFNRIASRSAALGQAYQAAGGEGGFIETNDLAPSPGNATFELTVRKAGPAFGARGRAVLYSDRDALSPGPGVRLLVLDDGSLFFETRGASGTTSATAAAALSNGAWAHVAATVSGTGVRIYVDGAQVAQAPAPVQWTASSSTAWIGAMREGPGGAIYRFNGDVDEVRVSNTVRY